MNRSKFYSLLVSGACALGCASKSTPATPERASALPASCAALNTPPPSHGAQYAMSMPLGVGQEGEWCRFFVAQDEMWVNGSELALTRGAHHSILWTTEYDAIPTENRSGETVDTSGAFPCPAGALGDWQVDAVVAASQSQNESITPSRLPTGVAFHVTAGQVLLMNSHMLNTSSQPIEPCFVINLETVPAAEVEHEAGFLQFYNLFVTVPAHGSSIAANACPVTGDFTLLNLVSHMHSRGVHFVANLESSDGSLQEQLFSGSEWHDPISAKFGAGYPLKAGQWLDYRCEDQNDSAVDVAEGLKTTDEMCVLDGTYYPRDRRFERCGEEFGSADGVQYNPEGTASGADFVACWYRSPLEFNLGAGPSNQAARYATQSCVTQLCRKAAKPVRPFIACMNAHGATCQASCPAAGPASWACLQTCIQEQ